MEKLIDGIPAYEFYDLGINRKNFRRMNYKSQSNEAELAIEYFGDRRITILDIGANDGITFSNSYDLIARGNFAHLFEPSSVFNQLIDLHRGNTNVCCYNKGMGDKVETVTLYESGAHVKGGTDKALVSTTSYEETVKWRKRGVTFSKRDIQIVDFLGWYEHAGSPRLEFISIDVEGMEWEILTEINLGVVGCEFLIIEWNGDKRLAKKFTEYCNHFGLTECGRNSENLMFCL